jgi:hypothetical protein
MFMSGHQITGQNHIRAGNNSIISVGKFKYLGTAATDQNFIHKEIKSKLNSENACYHAVQNPQG